MIPAINLEGAVVYKNNCLDILREMPDNSIDSIVTDPPYGLSDNKFVADTIEKWILGKRDFIPDGKGFMGKSWDAFVPPPAVWDECLRVLKPGGHLLAFFGTRTQDIGTLAIRLAGFEVRDSMAWLYGSGFPKSLDVSKAIDKAAGAERAESKTKPTQQRTEKGELLKNQRCSDCGKATFSSNPCQCPKLDRIAITDEAQQWQGWGTALKPAFEPIIVARKPIEGTVAANVLKWGTGGLNIDGSRIGTEERTNQPAGNKADANGVYKFSNAEVDAFNGTEATTVQGRWPANIILDPYTAELLDEQADASRFFYIAKASKRDRNEGLDELLETTAAEMVDREPNTAEMNSPRAGAGRTSGAANHHPTVKPTALMGYLIKLVTPPGGIVLDPFTGSGSTGKAALLNGFQFVGIEMTEEYFPIIEGRLRFAIDSAKADRTLF